MKASFAPFRLPWPPTHCEDTFGIVLGQGVAQGLNLKPGDHVTLLANTL